MSFSTNTTNELNETDSRRQIAKRLANLAALYEQAIFERDLAQRTQTRLIQELHLLQRKATQLETDHTHWHNSFTQVQSRAINAEAELVQAKNYIAGLNQTLNVILNSRGWWFTQKIRGLIGRRWRATDGQ